MASPSEPHSVGRHLLGPHVVGQRVVVRHVVRGEVGPSGGPALNDVLGTCRSWADGVVVIDSDRGPVEVAVADIVSGKPVPPRPSVRHRDSPRTVELHTHALWPDVVTEALGEWVLRSAPAPADGRPRRRANSALAMGDPGLPLEEAADRVRAWYDERGRSPMVMAVAGSEVESGLLALGWRDLGAAHCQVAGVAKALRGLDSARPPGGSARPPEGSARPRVVVDEDGERVTVRLGDGTATGRATLDGDWVVLDAIAVDPDHRRRGLATRVLAELLDWAASRGALTAMLQVETDNPGAVRLYEGLGFVTHHTYRYLVPAGVDVRRGRPSV